MRRISAANHHIIEFSDQQWWLYAYDEEGEQRQLLEALPDTPLQYTAEFASTRRLPQNGFLPLEYIWQVVLGWSHDDDAWHLGLLLARDLADARGSRWCQISYWPDADGSVFRDLAEETGQALAKILSCSFHIIPPRAEQDHVLSLSELPLELGMWRLKAAREETLELVRSRRWLVSRWMRVAWLSLWAAIFAILSISTLVTDLALPNAGALLPNPELLPYLGLGSAMILLGMILFGLYEIISTPNRIIVDGPQHKVAAMRGTSEQWYKNGRDLQSIYVTQVVNKRGKKRTVYHGEINLFLQDGKFQQVIEQPHHEEEIHALQPSDTPAEEAVTSLTSSTAVTDLQMAGLYIANTLGGLPAWYDQRIK